MIAFARFETRFETARPSVGSDVDATTTQLAAPTPRDATHDAKGYLDARAKRGVRLPGPVFNAGSSPPSGVITTSKAAENTVAMKCARTKAAVAAGIRWENSSEPKT